MSDRHRASRTLFLWKVLIAELSVGSMFVLLMIIFSYKPNLTDGFRLLQPQQIPASEVLVLLVPELTHGAILSLAAVRLLTLKPGLVPG